MSDPSPLVFEICTAIDRFQERTPDLSVSEVLAALDEVSSALARAGAPKRQSRPNVVSFSDYKRSTLTRTMTKDIDTLAGHNLTPGSQWESRSSLRNCRSQAATLFSWRSR